jgi:hypothetical protein
MLTIPPAVTGLVLTLTCDATPPSTTATPSPTPNGAAWNNTNVTITLHAVDDGGGSGVKEIVYSAAGAQSIGSTSIAGDTAVLPLIATEGDTVIRYHATDNSLNSEADRMLTIRLDKTNPTVTFATAVPTANAFGWRRGPVSVPFTTNDGPIGPATARRSDRRQSRSTTRRRMRRALRPPELRTSAAAVVGTRTV